MSEQTSHLQLFSCSLPYSMPCYRQNIRKVGAGDLDVGDCRQHHQMAHLDLNVPLTAPIYWWAKQEKEQLIIRCQTVFGES